MLGALLVTVAAVATFAAYTGASTGPRSEVVISRVSAAPFHRLAAGDLQIVKVDLPSESLAQAFSSPSELEGAITLSAIEPGDVIQRSSTRLSTAQGPGEGSSEPTHEVSFAIERDRAVNGRLQPGETVDVLATYGSGESAYTATVAPGALVSDVGQVGGSSLGSTGKLSITLRLASARSVLEVAHANQVAAVTLVRTTGLRRDGQSDDGGAADVFRPEPPPESGAARATSTSSLRTGATATTTPTTAVR